MSQTEHDTVPAQPSPPAPVRRGPLQSIPLRLAILITLIGLGLWAYALATRSPEPVAGGSPSAMAAGLAPSAASQAPRQPSTRLIDESSPVLFRFGLSFVVGFFLAWVLRKVITTTLLIAGAIATLVLILKKTGVINLDWDAVQRQVGEGVELAKQEAGRVRDVVLGYLPSGFSAMAGLFFGAKRRA
ncbi:MAG: hypothetical protein IT438_09595 [Phycisphaerales bacterium]|nr:hypothetical protein [Phycisphaerales bacterium]